ncbi:MAG: hypothetical protein EBV05_13620 [Cyanobacteria bacterium WB6_1B_304]|nr:hypothetical protein [Cyanobacteria bacterium WB6_1B_304]
MKGNLGKGLIYEGLNECVLVFLINLQFSSRGRSRQKVEPINKPFIPFALMLNLRCFLFSLNLNLLLKPGLLEENYDQ